MKFVSLEYLRANFRYDPETGEIFRRVVKRGVESWELRTTPSGNGYINLNILRVPRSAHRVAWALTYGEWPKGYIDHINGNGRDNRLCNLRDVDQSVNMHNRRGLATKKNKLGVLGVSVNRGGFRARISINKKTRHLGTFPSVSEAQAAYLEAKRRAGLEVAA